MDTYRAFLAIIISFVILVGYQYLFVGFDQPEVPVENGSSQQGVANTDSQQQSLEQVPVQQTIQQTPTITQPVAVQRDAKKVTVETDLYTAVVSEMGGTINSFVLKNHKETNADDSLGKELLNNEPKNGFPLKFSWGSVIPSEIYYKLNNESVSFADGKGELSMSAVTTSGLEIEKTFVFDQNNYLMDLFVTVKNPTTQPLQGSPQLNQVNVPFQQGKSAVNRFMFSGPAAYLNGELEEYKAKEFKEGPLSVQGGFDWVAYEGTYFMCAVLPEEKKLSTFVMQGDEDLVRMQLSGALDTLEPGAEIVYKYHLFYGPKKLSLMQEIGFNLDKSVNFGWFDIIARPTLSLLNFFYGFLNNYGLAIIFVTIIFKAVFWPITQKGLKSMKNMQKLQPKMVKIKEKYKDDPTTMNREVMNLYKTYKVNPLGGCLPMVLQIPVFFALYKVLLQCIELRHAPFMLWITDLSAPDRLWIGLDIPYLGGLPVLTLLMGASMFLQQKLTPTTADPTQAKIMMMLPVVFTFMFLNFASGLVLYWFINNLLSILQQQLINRGAAKTA